MHDSASTANAAKRPGAGLPRQALWASTLALALLILAADLFSKQTLWVGDPFPVIPGFFAIVPRENTGGVFGLLAGNAGANAVFIGVSCGAILFIGWIFAASSARLGLPFALAVGLILGGAVGNLVDRVFYGFVRDFLEFYVEFSGERHVWPTFNVADAAICTGTALLAFRLWTHPAESP